MKRFVTGITAILLLIGAGILWFTRERFPLTRLVYVLILLHCIILMIGGHYTYALVPLGDWVQEAFDQARNGLRLVARRREIAV